MRIRLEDWQEVILESRHGNIQGRVAYGCRKPIAPGNAPLVESHSEMQEKGSHYWFVDKTQDTKVRLYFPARIGRDSEFFPVKIRRR